MTPHGDRRDGTKSIRIETQEERPERKHYVVGVFILRNDAHDLSARPLFVSPAHQIRQRMALAERVFNIAKPTVFHLVDRAHWYYPHDDLYESNPEAASTR